MTRSLYLHPFSPVSSRFLSGDIAGEADSRKEPQRGPLSAGLIRTWLKVDFIPCPVERGSGTHPLLDVQRSAMPSASATCAAHNDAHQLY